MKLTSYMRYFQGLIFFTVIFNCGAQAQDLTFVKNSITALADNFPQEKIYLHFDKPSYAPGETAWFKAYLMAGSDPSYISKTVYIDFIDANGRIVKHCIQPDSQSAASGDFEIPIEYKNELLFVKAYTRWMANFDFLSLYHKSLHIIQAKPVIKKQVMPAIKIFHTIFTGRR